MDDNPEQTPNHWRTALIALVVVGALAGGIVWIKSAEETPDQAAAKFNDALSNLITAEKAAGDYVGDPQIHLGPQTRCLINRDIGMARFMIGLRNSGDDGPAVVHPLLFFKDGGVIDDKAYDRRETVVGGVPDSVEIDVGYTKGRQPKSCNVRIGSGPAKAIRLRVR